MLAQFQSAKARLSRLVLQASPINQVREAGGARI